MDLNAITLQQIVDFLLKTSFMVLAPSGIVFLTLRFFGHKIFGSMVEDVVAKYYKEVLQLKVDKSIENSIKNNNDKIEENMNRALENHTIKCKNENLTSNDDRYILRQEFKMYMESQVKTNERLEETSNEIRKLCDLILLKLNN